MCNILFLYFVRISSGHNFKAHSIHNLNLFSHRYNPGTSKFTVCRLRPVRHNTINNWIIHVWIDRESFGPLTHRPQLSLVRLCIYPSINAHRNQHLLHKPWTIVQPKQAPSTNIICYHCAAGNVVALFYCTYCTGTEPDECRRLIVVDRVHCICQWSSYNCS